MPTIPVFSFSVKVSEFQRYTFCFLISLLNLKKSTRLQIIYSFPLLVTAVLLSKLFCFLLFSIILSFQTTVIVLH